MNKGVWSIAAMGAAGCFLMGLAMHQLAGHRESRRPDGPAEVLQRRFAAHIVGPIDLHAEHDGRGHRLVANVRVPAGTGNPKLGDEVAAELQRLVAAMPSPPFEVVVEVRAEGSTRPWRSVVPMPAPTR